MEMAWLVEAMMVPVGLLVVSAETVPVLPELT